MNHTRILIAGIGNIFLGDDGFGVEVARHLVQKEWPEGVRVTDFGIRGFDLAYAMMDDYDVTILVDALSRGEAPGTLFILEANLNELNSEAQLNAHGMNPEQVLHLLKTLGGQPKRVLVVGCEPQTFGPEGIGVMGLSEPVQNAIAEAVKMVEELVEKLRHPKAVHA